MRDTTEERLLTLPVAKPIDVSPLYHRIKMIKYHLYCISFPLVTCYHVANRKDSTLFGGFR
jgi:hypothetical protein